MSSANRELTIIRIMAATNQISVSDDAERIYDRVITPLLAEARRDAWDRCVAEAWTANGFTPNPYRADKIAKGNQ